MTVLAPHRRVRLRVRGTVQGVGFRPYVYRLAAELELSGHVFNDSHGVVVEVEGGFEAVESFIERLAAEAPPLARVERVESEELAATGARGFAILGSPSGEQPDAPVTPDSATCDDCLAELFDPRDRRHRYPFVNCTNCGPRFTIVRGIPYDRPLTTMAGFEMCAACRAEYEDPGDRRFHAQPNACPDCGPRLRLVGREGDPLAAVAEALRSGAIVALKGIGGFHLACLADDEAAVARLRSRKHREQKPFALMVRDLDAARRLAETTPEDETLLASPQRPIVLVRRRPDAPVAHSAAPLSPDLGLMLPYSPLHHLLLADAGEALVMTSGNVSDEPIAYRDEDALERLGGIADLFLLHDRPIQTRTDDSVLRTVEVAGRRSQVLRRSRGYVPASVALPVPTAEQVLACGAELKNTFCLAKGERAWVGHHIGDLENYETLRSFERGHRALQAAVRGRARVVAHDLHPEYLSTKYALDARGGRARGRAAPPRAPGRLPGRARRERPGARGDLRRHRLRHGRQRLGRRAARSATCTASSASATCSRSGCPAARRRSASPGGWRAPGCARRSAAPRSCPRRWSARWGRSAWHQVALLARGGLASPVTTSMGRLFDAVAALCRRARRGDLRGPGGDRARGGLRSRRARQLPAAADRRRAARRPAHDPRRDRGGGRGLGGRRRSQRASTTRSRTPRPPPASCWRSGCTRPRWCSRAACSRTAACSRPPRRCSREAGLRVLTPELLPPNDGGVAYGQAAVAAARMGA